MLKTLISAFKDKVLRKKLFITFAFLLIFRLGVFIPVPGIDAKQIAGMVQQYQILQVLQTVSGGSLQNATLFSLGILPFINSFIIMQLLTLIIPGLERLTKEGDQGRAKVTQITRYVALVLGVIQSIGVVIIWKDAITPMFGNKVFAAISMIIYLVAGSCIVMWIGEKITEYGVGNGSSLIIMVGILASSGSKIINSFAIMAKKPELTWQFVGVLIVVLLLFLFIVFIDLSERRIKVHYAKQVKGNKMYGGQSTYIPLKVNSTSVMPIIFASSFLLFPQMIASLWPRSNFYKWWQQYMGVGGWIYSILLVIFIFFFTFFYSQIQFNPIEVAKNLQQYGGSIIGIRPGKPTSDFLRKINLRVTFMGAMFLAVVAIIPTITFMYIGKDIGLTNVFSATGLLIVVAVSLEFNNQLEAQLMMKSYKGFLK